MFIIYIGMHRRGAIILYRRDKEETRALTSTEIVGSRGKTDTESFRHGEKPRKCFDFTKLIFFFISCGQTILKVSRVSSSNRKTNVKILDVTLHILGKNIFID
jgi:hypothetical protein